MALFDNVRFGDHFRTRDGRRAVYLKKSSYRNSLYHYFMATDHPNDYSGKAISRWHVDENGKFIDAVKPNSKCDIICRWTDNQ